MASDPQNPFLDLYAGRRASAGTLQPFAARSLAGAEEPEDDWLQRFLDATADPEGTAGPPRGAPVPADATAVAIESEPPQRPDPEGDGLVPPPPGGPGAVPADATVVAPGAIDPSRENRTVPERYLDWRAEQAERVEEELRGPRPDGPSITAARPLASTPFGDIPNPFGGVASKVANSRLGRVALGASELVGLTGSEAGPLAAIAGDAPAGLAAGGGLFGRTARAAEGLPATATSTEDVARRVAERERAAGVPLSENAPTDEVARRIASREQPERRSRAEDLGDASEVAEQVAERAERGPTPDPPTASPAGIGPIARVLEPAAGAATGAAIGGTVDEESRVRGALVGGAAGTVAGAAAPRMVRDEISDFRTRGNMRAGSLGDQPDLNLDEIAEPHRSSIRRYLEERATADPERRAQIDKSIEGLAWEGRKRAAKLRGDAEAAEAAKDPVIENVVREFGVTSDPREAGYILSDGRMLDFSGKRQGGPPGARVQDHREIAIGYPDDVPPPRFADEGSNAGYMLDFMERGSIRVSAHSGGSISVDLIQEPTPEQLRRIRQMVARERGLAEVAIDVTRPDGEVLAATFLERARPADVEEAIARLFREARAKGGEGPLRMGFASARLLEPLAGAGAGAAAGAVADDESPVRGAVAGGAAGAAAGAGARPLARRLQSGRPGGVSAPPSPPPTSASPPPGARPKLTDEEIARELEQAGGGPLPPTGRTAAATAGPEGPDPEDFVNLRTFALDPAGEARLRDEVTRVVQREGLHPKEVVTHGQTRQQAARIAKDLGLNPDDISLKAGRLSGAEMLAIRNVVRTNVEQAEALSRRFATDQSMTTAEREIAERTLSALEAQNEALLSRFVKERSQTGRDLNNLKILAASSMDPFTWYAKARRLLKERPFTDEIRADIQRFINNGDREGLVRYVNSLRRASPGEKATTLWKAGLLTGPPTHLANALGNTTMVALETAKDAPAELFDRLLSLVTGQRTKSVSFPEAIQASLRGARRGEREAAQVMRGVPLDEGLRKYDHFRQVNYGDTGLGDFLNQFVYGRLPGNLRSGVLLNGYTNFVFRSLVAVDRIGRGAALERSLIDQARVLARREGLRGHDLSRRARELAANPSDEMVLQAIHDAEIATFTNRGLLGSVGSGIKRNLREKSEVAGVAGEVIAPFTMTPANVATRVAEYSPLGALSTIPDIVRLVRRSVNVDELPALQRKVVERLGRSSIGTAPILAGWILAANGRMTGGYPSSRSEQDQWQLEGQMENAVLVNGKWRSVERISPLGNLMVLGAHLHDVAQNPDLSTSEQAVAGAWGIPKTLFEQSFLQGAGDALRVIEDPERYGPRYVRNLGGSVVPSMVGRVARVGDPYVRDTEGVKEAIQARIPGLRKKLPPRLNQFGEPIETDPGFVANVLDPFTSRDDRRDDDPLIGEMARVGAQVSDLTGPSGIDRETYRLFQQIYGERLRQDLERLILSTSYNVASADEQREMIEDAARDSRATVTRELERQGLR